MCKALRAKECRGWLEEGGLAELTAEKPQECAYPYKVISFPFFFFNIGKAIKY